MNYQVSDLVILYKARIGNLELSDQAVERSLEGRDSDEFGAEWMIRNDIIENMVENNPLSAEVATEINKFREYSFKYIYAKTLSSDLSAYVSDDFDLILKSIYVGFEDEFISYLSESYLSGVIPYLNQK